MTRRLQGAPGAWIGQVPTKTPIQCLWYHGWSPWRTCQFYWNGKRLNPRTSTSSIWNFNLLHCWRNLESILTFTCVRTFLSFSPKPCRRQYFWFFGLFRRNHVADVFGLFYQHYNRRFLFDDEFGHGNHSGELLLFVGCFVNFVVSYLICMFQDSVPAGSYNDPVLSSVCV